MVTDKKKIIVACDSFKGSMTAVEVCDIIKSALKEKDSAFEVTCIPVADGGEGTVDAFLASLGGEKSYVTVKSPLMNDINAYYGLLDDGKAVIEVAQASGINSDGETRDALAASSYGTGQLIKSALDAGVREFYIGLGGSATTDGAAGLLTALGARLLDKAGRQLPFDGGSLERLASIDLSAVDSRVYSSVFTALCDVSSPLYGENGAAHVFSPQKGADTAEKVCLLDNGLRQLAEVCNKQGIGGFENEPGAGAAGGIGFGLMTFLNARLQSGIDAVLDLTGFDELSRGAYAVITGEGKMDSQSFSGKVPVGVVKRSKARYNIAVVGLSEVTADEAKTAGFDGVYETNPLHRPFAEVKPGCREDLFDLVKNLKILGE